MLLRSAIASLSFLLPLGASAHEFWIDAADWQIAAGDKMVADIRVGQDFVGPSFAYLSTRFRRFEVQIAGQTLPVTGRAGDKPALNLTPTETGLAVVTHVTTDNQLTYREWEKFQTFLAHKDWENLAEVHTERGLPETGFRERYSRYGKALIAVGDGAGADLDTGMLTEIVALANPYVDDLAAGLPVLVTYDGAPRANAQVEVFQRAPDKSVTVDRYRTDGAGRALLPVKSGHDYLVDAVVIRALDAKDENDPVWESLWASLTFSVP
ncbi:DUF4198 domain-containing protein [Phaeobacter sp. J2-8]|uniref:DUF4198 domain-containing protein n=1 Tax=Phaeobacter sp. J2-8 TaxID=2931394 RepID=UPI001FD3B7D4|nr:DUF4198 domain-containing protein [Phaeobacter sp. J2-8]MCJ7871564.1 DUF4198 domain-containing protein [Phaeobacter sp. J2-8]